MIRRLLLAAVFSIAMLFIPEPAVAQPLTCGFQGTVTAGGESLPDGTMVSAWIDGVKMEECQTAASEYSLFINGNYIDKTVTFKVGKYVAEQTATWTRGQTLTVNLSINSWPYQCEFYGEVTIDGQHVPDGTEVSAWIDSAKVQATMTTDSMFSLNVPGNYTGKAVSFKIDGHYATQIVAWERGEAIEVNLIVSLGPLVCGFYGPVTLDDSSVPYGTDITAWIGEAKVQTTSSGTGTFALNIPGDHTGKTVTFQVDGQAAKGSAVWVRGGNIQTTLIAVTKGTPIVTTALSSRDLEPGDSFTLTITVDPNGHGISGGEIDLLSLDSDVFEILPNEVESGNLLGSDPIEGVKEIVTSESGDSLHYALARTGVTPIPTPANNFAVIGMRIKGGAESGRYALPNAITITDESFNSLDFDPPTLSITVIGSGLQGDLNSDRSVGLADLAILASAYGTTTGDTGFRADADLNSNDEIDLGDLAILAGNWGLQEI